jgi:hypothetical protein
MPLYELQAENGKRVWISAYFAKTAVVETTGETKVYAFHHDAQNHDQERYFCPNCGTTLFWYVSSMPESIGIAGGCFADEGLPNPTFSLTDSKRWSWVSLPKEWKICEQ